MKGDGFDRARRPALTEDELMRAYGRIGEGKVKDRMAIIQDLERADVTTDAVGTFARFRVKKGQLPAGLVEHERANAIAHARGQAARQSFRVVDVTTAVWQAETGDWLVELQVEEKVPA